MASENLSKRLAHALTDKSAAAELLGLAAGAGQTVGDWQLADTIVATAASATTDFGSLLVTDRVIVLPFTFGALSGGKVAVAGTLPVVPVIGDLVLVYRVSAAPVITL